MIQSWYDLLFAHWPVAPEKLRPLIPQVFELDIFERQAWVAVTPFHMDMRPRGLPVVKLHFPEMNCRTYVSYQGKPGVYFFSLDAGSRLAVWGARSFYHLPYFYSRMNVNREENSIAYTSKRLGSVAAFAGRYRAESEVRLSEPGSLEHWLTERYCLYTSTTNHIYRGEIHHLPWPLQNASCEIQRNSVAAAAGIELPDRPPLLHFAERIDVLIWPLRRADL